MGLEFCELLFSSFYRSSVVGFEEVVVAAKNFEFKI
jgi:hypothetical protein